MAAAGFIFLAQKYLKKIIMRRFWVRQTLSKGKILTFLSVPYSTFELNYVFSTLREDQCTGSETCNKTETL